MRSHQKALLIALSFSGFSMIAGCGDSGSGKTRLDTLRLDLEAVLEAELSTDLIAVHEAARDPFVDSCAQLFQARERDTSEGVDELLGAEECEHARGILKGGLGAPSVLVASYLERIDVTNVAPMSEADLEEAMAEDLQPDRSPGNQVNASELAFSDIAWDKKGQLALVLVRVGSGRSAFGRYYLSRKNGTGWEIVASVDGWTT